SRSESAGSILPVISSVTSVIDTVIEARLPGPAGSSSARVLARQPFSSRSRSGVELYWSALRTQWWFVMMRPSGDTNDALHPPSDTTAPIGEPARFEKRFASTL